MLHRPGKRVERGFTLLELMIVVSILGIIASIGVPQYLSALRAARVGKAKHELRTISSAVDSYIANNDGNLPLSLYQVGFGGKRDPWGIPYCYLNYAAGTGDGLDWAISAGVVDPSAFAPIIGGGSGGDGGSGSGQWQGKGQALGQQLAAVAGGGQNRQLSGEDFAAVAQTIGRELSLRERLAIESSVAEHGNFSLFAGVTVEDTRRRDRYMFPLNTDYDLFSLGPDKLTATSLGEKSGLDDVIRANNGGYFGPAEGY